MKIHLKILAFVISLLCVSSYAADSSQLGIWEGELSPEIDERGVFEGRNVPIRIKITASEIQAELLIENAWTGFIPEGTKYTGNSQTVMASVQNLMESWSEIYSINIHFVSSSAAVIYLMKTSNNYRLKQEDPWKTWHFIAKGHLDRR